MKSTVMKSTLKINLTLREKEKRYWKITVTVAHVFVANIPYSLFHTLWTDEESLFIIII